MKNIVRVGLALAAGAFAVWLWLLLFPSPEKVITRQFEKLAQAATVQAGEGYLPRMAGAQTAGNFFATKVDVNIDIPHYRQHTTMSRDDIVQGMMAAKLSGGVTVEFPDISVSVNADKENAQADITVEARVPGEQDMIIQEMKFTLQKIDGQWLITKVQTVRPLS